VIDSRSTCIVILPYYTSQYAASYGSCSRGSSAAARGPPNLRGSRLASPRNTRVLATEYDRVILDM
jgi:hypothetical protein